MFCSFYASGEFLKSVRFSKARLYEETNLYIYDTNMGSAITFTHVEFTNVISSEIASFLVFFF